MSLVRCDRNLRQLHTILRALNSAADAASANDDDDICKRFRTFRTVGHLPSFIQLPVALALECIKFVMGRDSAPDPAGELIQRSPDLLAGSKGALLLRGGKGKEREGKR